MTWRMVLFTMFQGLGLVILWVVKSTPAALAFPFFVVAMIPYRMFLKFIFTACELEALDGAQAGKDYEDTAGELDFYETANDCPITPATQMPLHRSLMGLVNIPAMMGGKGKSCTVHQNICTRLKLYLRKIPQNSFKKFAILNIDM